MLKNKCISEVVTFADDLVCSLKCIVNYLLASDKSKSHSISKRSLRMWKAFHQYVASGSFKKKWKDLFTSLSIEVSKSAVIIQHTARIIVEILIQGLMSDTPESDNLPVLTVEEDNAIRFACGYVVKSIKKKFQKSEVYIEVLDAMHETDESSSDSDVEITFLNTPENG